jgi:hypothetical protein
VQVEDLDPLVRGDFLVAKDPDFLFFEIPVVLDRPQFLGLRELDRLVADTLLLERVLAELETVSGITVVVVTGCAGPFRKRSRKPCCG